MPTYGLGRNVEHDPLSRNFPAPIDVPVKTVLWVHKAPVLDQGNLGSCTGNALAQCLNTENFAAVRAAHHGGQFLTEGDAVSLYSQATRLDNAPGHYPPDDTGSSGLAVCKAGKKQGYLSSYNHAFGLDHLLAALQLQPVIVGTAWYDAMMTPSRYGYVTPKGSVAGGHEYLCLGCDVKKKRLTFLNSWSDTWGLNGRFYITFVNFDKLLADQGDVTVPVAAA